MKILITLLLICNLSLYSTQFSTSVQGFEENRGQLGDTEGKKVKEVIFYTKYKDFGVYITEKGVSYVIYRYEEPPQAAGMDKPMLPDEKMPKPVAMHYSRIDIDLVNSSIERSNIEYKEELPGYSNYYLGHCPEGVLYVKSYREVRIKEVYPGIDWIWRYDERGELHHEFELSEESAPEAIKLKINYADYEITENGKKLILSTPIGKIEDGFVIGHRSESMIFPIEVSYVENPDKTIGYRVSNWERSSKLIIDPPLSLTWATFYGGNQLDRGNSITTDVSGNVFVTGFTTGGSFPLQDPGGGAYYQGTYGGSDDAFILKFTNSGVREWATFYGGNQSEAGYSIKTDNSGNVFVTGITLGGTFPLLDPGGGAYYQGTHGGGQDAFILKFTNSGVRQWATFYGGNQPDLARFMTTDISGNIFAIGATLGGTFSLLDPGGGAYYQGTHGGGTWDVFILKFTNSGVRQWATFYGGNQLEDPNSISVDMSGNIFITGRVDVGGTFPLLDPGGGAYYQGTYGGGSNDIFILKFTNTGVRQWATFYGGNGSEQYPSSISDVSGNLFIVGQTTGGTFPLLDPGGGAYYQGTYGGGSNDIFILKFTNSGLRQWATFYGGNQNDNTGIAGSAVTVDASNNIFITGVSWGGTFPLLDPGGGAYYQGTSGGASDAILLKFNNTGVRQWATFYGGTGSQGGYAISTDTAGNLFVTGEAASGTFPLYNPGGGAYYQGTYGGGTNDAFILKFGDAPVPVTMREFNYRITGKNNVMLKWITEWELNNAGFHVERRKTGKDWEVIGFVNGNGTTNEPKEYYYTDNNLSKGIYEYRLKQIDYNSSYEYHNLSGTVDIASPVSFEISQNYPNPSNPVSKISFSISELSKVKLTVYDVNGREVARLIDGELESDYYTVEFNGSGLASGIYFYQITAEGESGQKFTKTMKMILVK